MTDAMTSQQVADALGVHRVTVHRWAAAGRLEAEIVWLDGEPTEERPHPPKLYLFDRSYIEDKLARRTVAS